MKAIRWLDLHFEEALLLLFLALICVVELMQVICRNVPAIPALTWAEEFCRFVWIATVFISLGYTLRTDTTLKVTALVDLLPWKLHNLINVLTDILTFVLLGVLSYYSVIVVQVQYQSGTTSSAMLWPMWIMYVVMMVGYALGTFRAAEMCVIHIKHFNEPPANSFEAEVEHEVNSIAAADRVLLDAEMAAADDERREA